MMGPRRPVIDSLRDEWLLSGTILALGGVLNGQAPAPLRIPAGLAACCLAATLAGATREELGLEPAAFRRGLVHGLLVGVPPSAAIAAVAVRGNRSALYLGKHITEASAPRAAYEAFIRIPLGTALVEEFLFRGALLAVLSRNHARLTAVAISSLLFGVWHVAPALQQSGEDGFDLASRRLRALHIAATVAATGLAGAGLAALRLRSESIAAPFAVHALVNGAGYLAAWAGVSHQRQQHAPE
jgi:membrane protease YdiL (CAAX protease family)